MWCPDVQFHQSATPSPFSSCGDWTPRWPSPAASPLFCITPIRLGVPNVTEIEAPAALCVAADPLAVATPLAMVAVNETADMVVLPCGGSTRTV